MQIRAESPDDFNDAELSSQIQLTSAQDFIVSLVSDILQMEVSNQAKIRKIKEYWCLLSKALPGSEERKRKVLHASDLDAILRLIEDMAK